MIAAVKSIGTTAERVVCVAGSRHLVDLETGYQVSESFPNECVVIIPKATSSESDIKDYVDQLLNVDE